MKKLVLLTFLILNLNCFGQKNNIIFEIKKGEKFVVVDSVLKCESFIMNDSSTLVITSSSFMLIALDTKIGKGCSIIGDGIDGGKGVDGVSHPNSAGRCNNGAPGGNGGPGENGKHASNISIRTEFTSIGDLYISAKGGKGGKGGNGGQGQKGGKKKWEMGMAKCGGGNGGNGGDSGKAGVGGNGGIVHISFVNSGTYILDKIKVSISRGENGAAGSYGPAGEKGTGTDDKKDGASGKQINQDLIGKDGDIVFDQYDDLCMDENLNETHAVIISVSDYENPEPEWYEEAKKLYFTLSDSFVFASIDTLFNPNYNELLTKLNEISKKSGNYIIYLSGHGVELNERSYGFLLPDGNKMPFVTFTDFINNSEPKTMLFILQCCYSGKLYSGLDFNNSPPTSDKIKLPEKVCGKNSRIIISAGFDKQSVDIKMTSALNDILKKNKKHHITASEMFYDLIMKSGFDLKDNPTFGTSNKFLEGDFIFHKKQ
jgi:hypothetical protein